MYSPLWVSCLCVRERGIQSIEIFKCDIVLRAMVTTIVNENYLKLSAKRRQTVTYLGLYDVRGWPNVQIEMDFEDFIAVVLIIINDIKFFDYRMLCVTVRVLSGILTSMPADSRRDASSKEQRVGNNCKKYCRESLSSIVYILLAEN